MNIKCFGAAGEGWFEPISIRLPREAGMTLHAGHGLNYQNVLPVAAIPDMHELNIGHSIVARAIMVGMGRAVREMKQLLVRECKP